MVLIIPFGPAHTDIPQVVSYQGKVTDTGGTPVADGDYTMRFRIYDASSGGNLEWDSGDRTIAVSGGVFNVLLGESPQPGIAMDFDEDYWLLVTVAGDDQTPRQRLGSVGYAYMASGLVPGTEVSGSVTSGTYAAIKGTNTGTAGTAYGLNGQSASNRRQRGVYGYALGVTGTTYGVYGHAISPDGTGIYYSNGLEGTGSKSCVAKPSQGPTYLYCQESPENWFEDFGEGQLVNGRAHVELDALFLETVTVNSNNPMKVFVQLRDDCKGTYVKTGQSGFDVLELQGGTSSAEFAYRVVAKRKGFEQKRLDFCDAGATDSYLYPELREKMQRELDIEKVRREDDRRMDEERSRL